MGRGMDLFSLTPAQYKAAAYLTAAADHRNRISIGKTELAEAMHISPAHAHRVLKSLVSDGFLHHVRRGVYRINADEIGYEPGRLNETTSLTHETKSLTDETKKNYASRMTNETTSLIDETFSLIDETSYAIGNTGNTGNTSFTSKEVNKEAAPEFSKTKKEKNVRGSIDDDDELQTVGFPPTPPSRIRDPREPRRRRTATDHVIKPRGQWSMYDAVQYLSASMEQRRPSLFGKVNTAEMLKALGAWCATNRVEVAEVIDAADDFVASDVNLDSLSRGVSPTRAFLAHLKKFHARPVISQQDIDAEIQRTLRFLEDGDD